MKIGGTPKEAPKDGLNFDLTAKNEPEGHETKTEGQTEEVSDIVEKAKNEEGEIVVPEAKEEKVTEVKAEEAEEEIVAVTEEKKEVEDIVDKKEPEGLTAIPTTEDNEDRSSLTQDSKETEVQEVSTSIDDKAVIDYLNEKYGKEYDSLDSFQEKSSETKSTLDDNPYLKGLIEWQERTGRPIEDYVKYQKDYKELSDLQVVREYLQMKYPTLNDAELSVEMNKYTPTDLDIDDDITVKNLELKKLSTTARGELEKLKGEFNIPVTSKTKEGKISPEVQEDLNLLKEIKTNLETNKQNQKVYSENISKVASNTNVLPLKLSDNLSLNYNINEVGRKEIPGFINEMSHWKNEDGSWNHNAVVNDGIKIKHFDNIIQLVYEQGVNSGKDSIIEQSKNSTLGVPNTLGGSSLEGQKGAQIEGNLDSFLGNSGMTIQLKGQ